MFVVRANGRIRRSREEQNVHTVPGNSPADMSACDDLPFPSIHFSLSDQELDEMIADAFSDEDMDGAVAAVADLLAGTAATNSDQLLDQTNLVSDLTPDPSLKPADATVSSGPAENCNKLREQLGNEEMRSLDGQEQLIWLKKEVCVMSRVSAGNRTRLELLETEIGGQEVRQRELTDRIREKRLHLMHLVDVGTTTSGFATEEWALLFDTIVNYNEERKKMLLLQNQVLDEAEKVIQSTNPDYARHVSVQTE